LPAAFHFISRNPDITISVIIPSFRRPADLRRCLEAIALQSRPANEVLVVGRQGDAETWAVVCSFQPSLPVLRMVSVSEPGLIAAMNCGLDNAAGEFLVFTDDDAGPMVDWLARIEAAFADSSIGAVGGRDWIQWPDQPAFFQPHPVSKVGIVSWYGKMHGHHHHPLRGNAEKVMFLKGVNMAFRRCSLGSYRIDRRLRGSGAQVGTEIDLCSQIRQSGFHVLFDDRILVKHWGSPRAESEDRNQLVGPLFRDICFNNHYLIAKHFALIRAAAYLCNERLLGSRYMPGVLAAAKWHFKGDPHPFRRSMQMTRIALDAFRAGRHARTLTRQHARQIAVIGLKGTSSGHSPRVPAQ